MNSLVLYYRMLLIWKLANPKNDRMNVDLLLIYLLLVLNIQLEHYDLCTLRSLKNDG